MRSHRPASRVLRCFSHSQKKKKKRRRLTENEKVICDNMITFNGGSLGSCIDEERSQLRYVVWIAEFSESSNLWTQMALLVIPGACLSECWSNRRMRACVRAFDWGVAPPPRRVPRSATEVSKPPCEQGLKCVRRFDLASTTKALRKTSHRPFLINLRSGKITRRI